MNPDQNLSKVMGLVCHRPPDRMGISLPPGLLLQCVSGIVLSILQGRQRWWGLGQVGHRDQFWGVGGDVPSAHLPLDLLHLPSHGFKVVGLSNKPLPWGLCANILPKGVGQAPLSCLGSFEGKIQDFCRRCRGNYYPCLHFHGRQQLPLPRPCNGLLEKVDEGIRGGLGG